MTDPKIVIVTGANRGIGLAICTKILKQHSPVHLYACSRSGTPLSLSVPSNSKLSNPKLDISSPSSIASFARTMEGGVDILINNAGTNDTNCDVPATEVLEVNYHGTKGMCTTFLPLMKKGGRIVNVSSVGSSLHHYSTSVKETLRSPSLSVEGLDKVVASYEHAWRAGRVKEEGFGGASGYSMSKAATNALTAILAREAEEEGRGVLVNCCCPGWVDTDMGALMGARGTKTPEEGARIPVRLAFGDLGGVNGKWFANQQVGDTGMGEVRDW